MASPPLPPSGSPGKPSKVSVSVQAMVLSAFVKAFGQKLMSGKSHHQARLAQFHEISEGTSRLWAKNAKLVLEDGIALLLDQLQAELVVRDPLSPLIPERPDGYVFHIHRGRMAMDAPSISHLLNRYAFPPDQPKPLSEIRVILPEGAIRMEANFRPNRWIAVALNMSFTPAVTPDGRIALVATEIRAGGLPVDKVMGLLGLQLEKLMPTTNNVAMAIHHDQIVIDPVGMLPAPKATGRLVEVEVTGEHLVMTYDSVHPPFDPPLSEPDAESYIAMLGHDLLVGKITMTDVCLQMIPLDADATWVELSLPHYRAQLAQGVSSLRYGDDLLYKLPAVAQLKELERRS